MKEADKEEVGRGMEKDGMGGVEVGEMEKGRKEVSKWGLG